MPTYQYACTESACGHRFEAVQSFSDDPLTSCPVCEGRLRKVFSAVGVVFKGSGFYRTDSREAAKNGSAAKGADGAEKWTGEKSASGEKKSSESSSASSTSSSSSSASSSPAPSGSGSSSSTSRAAAS